MFKNWKKKLIVLFWNFLPTLEKISYVFDRVLAFFSRLNVYVQDTLTYLKSLVSIVTPLLDFIKELKLFFQRKVAYVWLFLTKHKLLYVGRIVLILFILYKPTLIDLDSLYWLTSSIFYYISNTIFLVFGNFAPLSAWFHKTWGYKFFVIGSLLPALWTARRLRRRLYKYFFKFLLYDNELMLSFYWAQQLFVISTYYVVLFSMFFFMTFFLPVIYIYVSNFDIISVTKLFYNYYLSSFVFISWIVTYICSLKYFIFFAFNLYYVWLYFYTILVISCFDYTTLFFAFTWSLVKILLSGLVIWILASFYTCTKLYGTFIIDLISMVVAFSKWFFHSWSWKNFYDLVDVMKNFLFSDNYLRFIFLIITDIAKNLGNVLSNSVSYTWDILKLVLGFMVGESIMDTVSLNLTILKSTLLIYFYNKLIILLDIFNYYNELYFKDLTLFGILSTWYEYLNQNLQRGVSKHRFVNWFLIHFYASVLAFWLLDFDFRVSAKTPPKTPYTLLKEAKMTYDWIPLDMDLNALQTSHTRIYFALLDISFEHIESIQFVYGDYEHIDEEFDEEDETPDEEEFWVDSDETVQVREIIDSDLRATKLKTYWTKKELISFNPVSAYAGQERHFLSEIVGEPELVHIDEELKWAYEPLYSPSFAELHYKDSLFSEWVFDPEEDLTVFEMLLLFPLLIFFLYIWFYHRPLKRRHNSKFYYKTMIAVRRRIFSGFFIEDFFGIPLGDRFRRWIDAYRRYKAPEMRIKSWYKYRTYKNRHKFKIYQMEAYFFEKMRLKVFRKFLKQWEYGLRVSSEFLESRRHFPQFYSGVKGVKHELRTWIRLGDWVKFDVYGGLRHHKSHYVRFEDLQIVLPELFEQLVAHGPRMRKKKRRIWKTIAALPGHITMARTPKLWSARFYNKDIFYPQPHTKMRYSYNYYNYLGWRENRAQWRRYAFTPATFTDEIWRFHRGYYWREYTSLIKQQRKHRLIRALQF